MRQILLIDDADSDAVLLERALRMAGVANPIQRATSGADAIAFLNTIQTAATAIPVPLGIVFIDLKLPDKSGFDILKLMQGRSVFEDTLKVVVSSIDDMENIKRAYSLGADSFIAKPANQFDLKELLRSFPDHWYLVDTTSPPTPQAAMKASEAPDPYDEAIHVWAKHREIIRTLRHNLQVLRNQIADNDETFAIIETLTEELRNEIDPTGKNRPKKKPRNNLLL